MQNYTVNLSNSFTGKTKIKKVQAIDWQSAYTKAVSNYMMANAWGVDSILDEQNIEVWKAGSKLLCTV